MMGHVRMGFLLMAGLVFAGCDDTLFIAPIVELDPDLQGYCGVVALMDAQCISCHGSAAPTAGLDLETDLAATTIGVTGGAGTVYVEPGDSANSELFQRSGNFGPGAAMPPGSQGVGDDGVALMMDWIDGGATVEDGE